MWPTRSGDQPQLSLFEDLYVCSCDCVCARARSLCMLVRLWQSSLTYILLSTINSKEICVNQLPLRPACLLPPAGWQSRSADLTETKETISSDFHFFKPCPCPPPKSHLQFSYCAFTPTQSEFLTQLVAYKFKANMQRTIHRLFAQVNNLRWKTCMQYPFSSPACQISMICLIQMHEEVSIRPPPGGVQILKMQFASLMRPMSLESAKFIQRLYFIRTQTNTSLTLHTNLRLTLMCSEAFSLFGMSKHKRPCGPTRTSNASWWLTLNQC